MNIYLSMNGDTKVHYGYDLALRTKQILYGTLRDGTGADRWEGPFVWNRESWDRTSPLLFTSYWSGTIWFFSEHHFLTSA